jgi:thioredoxin
MEFLHTGERLLATFTERGAHNLEMMAMMTLITTTSALMLVQVCDAFSITATSRSSFPHAHHVGCANARHVEPLMGFVRQVTTAEFEEEIQECFYSKTPIVLDVFATWCGPCKMMLPELEKVAEHYGDRCRFLKVDADEEPEVPDTLKVGGLPTVLFVNEMRVVARAEGLLMVRCVISTHPESKMSLCSVVSS